MDLYDTTTQRAAYQTELIKQKETIRAELGGATAAPIAQTK
jgi:hypothetical protein